MFKIKRSLLALAAALIMIASCALPAFAQGPVVTENTDYITEDSIIIGAENYALSVRADGSFSYEANGESTEIVFAKRAPNAKVQMTSLPYPVSTHKFSDGGIDYSVRQFVYKNSEGDVFLYSRLKVKNNTDVSLIFPAVAGMTPITEIPEEIASEKSAFAEYALLLHSKTGKAADFESYKEAEKKMCAGWDALLADKAAFSGLPKGLAKGAKNFSHQLILCYIGTDYDPAVLALTAPELYRDTLSRATDPYAAALTLFKTGDRNLAAAFLPEYRAAASVTIPAEGLPFATIEENLDALLSLQSFGYILKVLEAEDYSYAEELSKVNSDAALLGDRIADVLKKVENKLGCEWEAATTDASYGIVLSADGYASAGALCRWYAKSSFFSSSPSKALLGLCRDSVAYYTECDDPAALMAALFTEKEDGTIVIGSSAPVSLLCDEASFKLKNVRLSSGALASLSVSVDKKTVTIGLTGEIGAPIQIRFPAFRNNIEYASTGFDSETGTVTAPEGTKSVTVRLIDSADSLEKERAASASLESALAGAYTAKSEGCTEVSKGKFDSALKAAEKARTSTADKKKDAAEKLEGATAALSPMTAGYVYSLPEDGSFAGSLTAGEIYQKFSLPSTGHVDTLTVKGVYCDGISAAVYTLRGDAYTTDELRAETYGTEVEGGIQFDLDFDFTKDTVYVLCIFCEVDDITLHLTKSFDYTAHTQVAGETVLYRGASLDLEFSVSQVNRAGLDTFYSACLEADLSDYTKESRKTLDKKMKAAEKILCTPSVTEEEYNKAYDDLKKAYDGLSTYASKDKLEKTPAMGIVLIVIVVVLLAGTFVSAIIARKKMDSRDN